MRGLEGRERNAPADAQWPLLLDSVCANHLFRTRGSRHLRYC